MLKCFRVEAWRERLHPIIDQHLALSRHHTPILPLRRSIKITPCCNGRLLRNTSRGLSCPQRITRATYVAIINHTLEGQITISEGPQSSLEPLWMVGFSIANSYKSMLKGRERVKDCQTVGWKVRTRRCGAQSNGGFP